MGRSFVILGSTAEDAYQLGTANGYVLQRTVDSIAFGN